VYINRSDPTISFLPVAVYTSGRIYDDFSRLMFLHAHREASVLTSEIPEESGQFRFLRPTSLDSTSLPNIKISIPLHSSSRSFIPLPHFIRSRRPTLLLSPSLVFSPLCSS
jgi:hypothetical protein